MKKSKDCYLPSPLVPTVYLLMIKTISLISSSMVIHAPKLRRSEAIPMSKAPKKSYSVWVNFRIHLPQTHYAKVASSNDHKANDSKHYISPSLAF